MTILEGNKPVLQKDIIVNDPLRYKGISIFQSSYGQLSSKEAEFSFTSRKSGMVYKHKAVIGQNFVIPENLGVFELKAFTGSAQFQGHNIGDAFVGTLTPVDGEAVEVILPIRFPSFDQMRKGEVVVAVADILEKYYTGLQVNKDPGVWLVYAGFILMIIGCYITFFMSHQQVCVAVDQAGESSRVSVSGTANKNKVGMQKKMGRISHELEGLKPIP